VAPLLEKIVTLSHRMTVNDNNPETLDVFVEALMLYEQTQGAPHSLDASLPEFYPE